MATTFFSIIDLNFNFLFSQNCFFSGNNKFFSSIHVGRVYLVKLHYAINGEGVVNMGGDSRFSLARAPPPEARV